MDTQITRHVMRLSRFQTALGLVSEVPNPGKYASYWMRLSVLFAFYGLPCNAANCRTRAEYYMRLDPFRRDAESAAPIVRLVPLEA